LSSAREFIAARDFLLSAKSYEDAKAGFAWPRPNNFNWALDYFDNLTERSNPALEYVDDKGVERKVSFLAMKESSNRIANLLRSVGLHKGERVLVMLPNRVELLETMLGAMKLGSVIIPASTLLTSDDIKDRLVRGRVRCVIADAQLVPATDNALSSFENEIVKINLGQEMKGWLPFSEVETQPSTFKSTEQFSLEDELLIYFTSGTTARPKLVLHTYGSYPIGHLSTMYWIGVKAGDVHYNISAPGWAKYAWSSVFGVWNAEATSFIYNYSGKFNPKEVLRIIEDHKIRTLCAPPTVWRFLLLENLKQHHFALRELVSAGEPLNAEIVQKVRETTGLTIREGFGQTETTLQIGTFPGMKVRPGSMGIEAPGYEISILNDEHVPVTTKTEGLVAIQVKPKRPLGLMHSYIDPPEKNLEAFVGDWYLTGDIAYKDDAGYFWFIGRQDDVFKSSDYRISAFELESELMANPSVTEVAIVASPDKLRGFVPKAIITLRPEAVASRELALEIFRFTRNRMAPYKRPRIIQFSQELPKTISGKIKRMDLRKIELQLRRNNERAQDEYFESDFPELKTDRETKQPRPSVIL
jgi:acetyl-CoA synthetase